MKRLLILARNWLLQEAATCGDGRMIAMSIHIMTVRMKVHGVITEAEEEKLRDYFTKNRPRWWQRYYKCQTRKKIRIGVYWNAYEYLRPLLWLEKQIKHETT